MREERISRQERRLGDQPATVAVVRARVIRWKHTGNACGCENKIVQLAGSRPRRACRYLAAKCGRCHQVVRLYQVRGKERWTIDPTHF